MVRECGCQEFVTQCEHYDGRVLQFSVHPESIVVRLEDGDSAQGSTCHSIITAYQEYTRYRVMLMGEERAPIE